MPRMYAHQLVGVDDQGCAATVGRARGDDEGVRAETFGS